MSEEKEKKIRIVTELKYPLPDVRLSFDSQFDIISAYVVASGGIKSPVGYKELKPYVKVDATMVSGCNKFFQHLGLIKPSDKTGKYTPTDIAVELHNGKKWKNENVVKNALRKVLDSSWFWNQTKQYLEINESATKEELRDKLGFICGADPQKHVRALDKLIEYMQFADLIKENDGRFVISDTYTHAPPSQEESHKKTESKIISKPQHSTNEEITVTSKQIGINFGIMINPETTEEQIRKAVRTVVDELEKIQKEKEGKAVE